MTDQYDDADDLETVPADAEFDQVDDEDLDLEDLDDEPEEDDDAY
jgi:hypothetical protein